MTEWPTESAGRVRHHDNRPETSGLTEVLRTGARFSCWPRTIEAEVDEYVAALAKSG